MSPTKKVLESYKDISLRKGRVCNEFFVELENQYSDIIEDEEVTKEELICMTIDRYMDLQRIKMANGDIKNEELDYQIKCATLKLSVMGVQQEDIMNITGAS